MKRFLIFTLIFAMLSCTAISLYAYNDKAKKTVNKYWAGCLAEDTDGPLFVEATIDADIDYPGEPGIESVIETFFRGYGIEYHAYARAKGEAPNDDYSGEYDLYASVCFDDDPKNGTWRGRVNKKVKADDFVKLSEELTSWDIERANDQLYPWAWGNIDGSSPEKSWKRWVNLNYQNPDIPPDPYTSPSTDNWVLVPMQRPAFSDSASADVWNFSFFDTRGENRWHCFFSGNTSCPECGGN